MTYIIKKYLLEDSEEHVSAHLGTMFVSARVIRGQAWLYYMENVDSTQAVVFHVKMLAEEELVPEGFYYIDSVELRPGLLFHVFIKGGKYAKE